MNLLDLAKNRYTTKMYDPNKKVSSENIQKLKEILRLSPSSINSQPWKFIFVSDENLKHELARASFFNEQKINEASHLVVFAAIDDVKLFEEDYIENLPDGAKGFYNQFVKPLPDTEIKSWLQHQVYISLGFFLPACRSLGIDSTPMEGIQSDRYRELLGLKNYKPLFAVAIGYRNPEDYNHPSITQKSRLPLEMVLDSI